jgi:hypothetical protein
MTPQKILLITSKIKYDNFTDEEDYLVKTPRQVLSTKLGICYDIVELERLLFNQSGYKTRTYFIYNEPIESHPTHTFLIFEERGKLFWFESSWYQQRGIHGPFDSYKNVLLFVVKKINYKKPKIRAYNKFNYSGMNINEFGNYIINNFRERQLNDLF